jgi:hypothetical protein
VRSKESRLSARLASKRERRADAHGRRREGGRLEVRRAEAGALGRTRNQGRAGRRRVGRGDRRAGHALMRPVGVLTLAWALATAAATRPTTAVVRKEKRAMLKSGGKGRERERKREGCGGGWV